MVIPLHIIFPGVSVAPGSCWPAAVVPKLGVNYPPGVICDSSGGNTEVKPQCYSVLWAIIAKYWG